MNNYVRKIASEYNIPINKITIKNNTRIIDDKIVLKKKKNNDLNNVYKYLKSRSFDYFPEPITIDNLYEVYPFLEDTYEPSEQKATDIMHLLGLLHSKTTFYREIDIDKNKEIYENISDELEYLNNFYNTGMDTFDYIQKEEINFTRFENFLKSIKFSDFFPVIFSEYGQKKHFPLHFSEI